MSVIMWNENDYTKIVAVSYLFKNNKRLAKIATLSVYLIKNDPEFLLRLKQVFLSKPDDKFYRLIDIYTIYYMYISIDFRKLWH